MMKEKWKVYKTPIANDYAWAVYRIIDPSQPMHSGNIESKGLFETEESAQALADKLNKEEESR